MDFSELYHIEGEAWDVIKSFPIFRFSVTWWRLFQKRIVHNKFDIFIFISESFLRNKVFVVDTIIL
jgi:hypothetical protein